MLTHAHTHFSIKQIQFGSLPFSGRSRWWMIWRHSGSISFEICTLHLECRKRCNIVTLWRLCIKNATFLINNSEIRAMRAQAGVDASVHISNTLKCTPNVARRRDFALINIFPSLCICNESQWMHFGLNGIWWFWCVAWCIFDAIWNHLHNISIYFLYRSNDWNNCQCWVDLIKICLWYFWQLLWVLLLGVIFTWLWKYSIWYPRNNVFLYILIFYNTLFFSA